MDAKNDLKEAIESAEENRRRNQRENEIRARQKELAEEKFWEEEDKKLKVKLEMTEEIFKWGKEFSRSSLYRRLDALGYDLVCYRSFWEHSRNGRAHGCVSRRWLEKDSTFFYRITHKWMNGGGMPPITFENPEEMAKRLTYDYLKELYDCIKSGEIYQMIVRRLGKMG